ncbi:T9SS type A sorting domain-containing protein [bacterium]|nr:T9SS type A sorting domain-containing protein [bacterium]MBU1652794.1 T9SS type A sorting domain-containing protein [bacterium]MBU1880473.1 T9SS type A sorting domain-containing protein [bacterium]
MPDLQMAIPPQSSGAPREGATLMDSHREAGTHNLTWDAGHLPSGVYFAHIRAGDYTSVQKLMLLK